MSHTVKPTRPERASQAVASRESAEGATPPVQRRRRTAKQIAPVAFLARFIAAAGARPFIRRNTIPPAAQSRLLASAAT